MRCGQAGAAPCDSQVVTRVLIPQDAIQAHAYGVDLDGNGTTDNALGVSLSAVEGAARGVDLQRNFDDDWVAGRALDLIRRQRASGGAKAGGQWILASARRCCDDPSDVDACRKQARERCFSGTASFAIESASGGMVAAASRGATVYGPGEGAIRLPVGPNEAITLRVRRLQFRWPDDKGRHGVVAGAILHDDVVGKLFPALASFIDSFITNPASNPNSVRMGLSFFDRDGDGRVSTQEFADNDLVKTFLAGDVYLDEDCKESALSFGFRFWSVPAKVR